MEAYCVKCKTKRDMGETEEVTKMVKGNPRKFLVGKCGKCGTALWRVMPKKE